jgi:Leucine-rich repeat (LRR) protein
MLPHDPGFVSGFIGVSIDVAIHHIFHHVSIALRCKEELNSLRDLVMRIEPIIKQIQQYRLALNRKRGIPISQRDINMKASAVNEWLKKLDNLLRKASTMAQECTIARYDLIYRYRTSRRITRLIKVIAQHLESVTLMGWASVLEGLGLIKESIDTANTSTITSEPVASTRIIINEPLIVGQHSALERLEKLVTDAEAHSSVSRIGVVGMGGSGKTLLLKTLFNSQKVRDLFSDGFLLWLTVSQSPSISSLRIELSTQIAIQKKVDPNTNMNIQLSESMQGKRFAMFLDDVWDEGSQLLEELGVLRLIHLSNSKIIVSTRNFRTLLEMGVAKESTIKMGDLIKDDSWRLFSYYAFPYNNGNVPAGIHQEIAKVVCDKCGGLPLAIKAVGRAMAGVTDANEWKFAVQRLPNANSKDEQAVYDRLRLSYDALGSYGVHLQLGFLYLAAASLEDQVIPVESQVILLWMGEGLLGKKKLQDDAGHDPFEMGRIYVDFLADRCLIEPTLTDVDGRVVTFRMHDILRAMAIQIAEKEENFYCGAAMGLKTLKVNEFNFSPCTRIVLNDNNLNAFPESWRAQEISSLLMKRNIEFKEIPEQVIGSMISLKILDLTNTSLQSFPESVGNLKQLVYLNLAYVPIKRLSASFTNLSALQILDLEGSKITELSSDLHKLSTLSYLNLNMCSDLQCLPSSISSLTSLQCLYIGNCRSMTWNTGKKIYQKGASVNHLGSLTQLKTLAFENYGEIVSEGTLGGMVDMETFEFSLTKMERLPADMFNMSKLRKLWLKCSHVVKMDNKFCEFQNLTLLKLWGCSMLEELPALHRLKSLRQLDIVYCTKLKRFPKGFGETGAFLSLEKLSMFELNNLEELPEVEEGAMTSLKIFTIILCEGLKMFPQNYLNFEKLQKVRVYGCRMVLKNLESGKNKEKNRNCNNVYSRDNRLYKTISTSER